MAKKTKFSNMIVPASVGEYSPPPISDNNPSGPSNLPDDRLEGARDIKDKFAFADLVAKGESPAAPDVNTVNANGVSKSRGQGKNCQYQWGDSLSGEWNENRDWEGANLTGM